VKHQNIVFLVLILVSFTPAVMRSFHLAETGTTTPIITAIQATWFIGTFLGTLARTLLPYPRKSEQIKQDGWNNLYTGTTIVTIILSLIVTGVALPMATIPQQFDTLFSLFWLAFGAGYGGNAALIELSEYLKLT
jgi:hypothetical protein